MTSSPAHNRNPNPQGKGLAPVLQDWAGMQPSAPAPKDPLQFLRDYCFSSLVLAAKFRFKPVAGVPYYLYSAEQDWTLSLVAPVEWGQRAPGEFLATCRLRPDMTWDMQTTELDKASAASARAQNFIQGFVAILSEQDSLATHLPFYAQHLPYYQRMLGTALASSLQRSLPPSRYDLQRLLKNQAGPFGLEDLSSSNR